MDIMHMDCGKTNYITIEFQEGESNELRQLGDVYLMMNADDIEKGRYHLAETHLKYRNQCYDMAEAMEERAEYLSKKSCEE